MVIPACPVPSPDEREAIQMAADVFPAFVTLEQRRIVHCCRLEVLRESPQAKRCKALIDELG